MGSALSTGKRPVDNVVGSATDLVSRGTAGGGDRPAKRARRDDIKPNASAAPAAPPLPLLDENLIHHNILGFADKADAAKVSVLSKRYKEFVCSDCFWYNIVEKDCPAIKKMWQWLKDGNTDGKSPKTIYELLRWRSDSYRRSVDRTFNTDRLDAFHSARLARVAASRTFDPAQKQEEEVKAAAYEAIDHQLRKEWYSTTGAAIVGHGTSRDGSLAAGEFGFVVEIRHPSLPKPAAVFTNAEPIAMFPESPALQIELPEVFPGTIFEGERPSLRLSVIHRETGLQAMIAIGDVVFAARNSISTQADKLPYGQKHQFVMFMGGVVMPTIAGCQDGKLGFIVDTRNGIASTSTVDASVCVALRNFYREVDLGTQAEFTARSGEGGERKSSCSLTFLNNSNITIDQALMRTRFS